MSFYIVWNNIADFRYWKWIFHMTYKPCNWHDLQCTLHRQFNWNDNYSKIWIYRVCSLCCSYLTLVWTVKRIVVKHFVLVSGWAFSCSSLLCCQTGRKRRNPNKYPRNCDHVQLTDTAVTSCYSNLMVMWKCSWQLSWLKHYCSYNAHMDGNTSKPCIRLFTKMRFLQKYISNTILYKV